jgi:hypothetical protein
MDATRARGRLVARVQVLSAHDKEGRRRLRRAPWLARRCPNTSDLAHSDVHMFAAPMGIARLRSHDVSGTRAYTSKHVTHWSASSPAAATASSDGPHGSRASLLGRTRPESPRRRAAGSPL